MARRDGRQEIGAILQIQNDLLLIPTQYRIFDIRSLRHNGIWIHDFLNISRSLHFPQRLPRDKAPPLFFL